MGSNFLNPKKLVDAGSLAANLTSPVLDVRYLDNVAIQLNWTGTPTGTFAVQGSIDNSQWNAISLPSTPAPAGSASTALVDLNQIAFPYLRVVYTASSGTGSLDMWVCGKGLS